MSTPLCSIVVPSFHQGQWIESALQSLLLQNDPALEIIIVDGGSTDGTRAVLERYRSRLTACIIEPDKGQADALAKGFDLARGDILGWLNSDDMHLPWTLATMRDAFAADPKLDVVHGDRVIIDAEGRITGHCCLPLHSAYLLSRWPRTNQETCFWRRQIWERVGGINREMRFAMDYDLFARLFAAGRCRHLRRHLGAFRWHSASKSFNQQTTIGSEEMALVRTRYGCTPTAWEYPIGVAFSVAVRACSRLAPLVPLVGDTRAPVGHNIATLWTSLRDAATVQASNSARPCNLQA
ncbi:MAG: glycosyltransferase family 2 protein [Phycisphaerae bacterium]|nr:glycosyltransferase family 2 protein [Phycisphaerae bacterium]